jgi:predicted RNA binding protein YcfA (HicA-like mRNA interferase family)
MRAIAGREFARMIERRGWQLLRVSGSHHIYGKAGSVVRLSVPIHANRPLKTGLLRHLAKLAEIPDEELR